MREHGDGREGGERQKRKQQTSDETEGYNNLALLRFQLSLAYKQRRFACQAPNSRPESCGLPPRLPILSPKHPTLAETQHHHLLLPALALPGYTWTCATLHETTSSSMGINKKRKPIQFVIQVPFTNANAIISCPSSLCLDNLISLVDHLGNFFVFVLKKPKCICNIVPLPLVLRPW